MTNTTTFKSSELGRTVELTTYVDPAPGLKGTDQVPVECGYCNNGVYMGFSRITWEANGRKIAAWCFRCNGTNVRYVSANTARRNAKAAAFAAEYAEELRAVRQAAVEAANAAIAAAEAARAEAAAKAEAERIASLVQGFVGEKGEKVTVTGTVRVAKYIAGSWNRSSKMFIVVDLDNGQVVMTSGSGQSLFEVNRGDRITLTAKVADFGSFNGQDQTVLSHAKAQVLEAAE